MRSLSSILLVLSCTSSVVFAACPSADLTGDCRVDFEDFAVFVLEWLTEGTPGPDGMEFVNIPAGTLQMGDPFGEGSSDELPVHSVTLRSFSMSKSVITNGQYCEYLNSARDTGYITVYGAVVYAASDSSHRWPYFYTYPDEPYSRITYSSERFIVCVKGERSMRNDPVVEVSWCGAEAFCEYYGFRLPTEAEWEYAARGGLNGRRFPWGYSINHSQANYLANGSLYAYDSSPYTTWVYHPTWNDGIIPYTSPAGSFSANGYGLYDMAGNVSQWCSDLYLENYYSSSPSNNPTGPATGEYRVIRGAGWNGNASVCRVANRSCLGPDGCSNNNGFRACRD